MFEGKSNSEVFTYSLDLIQNESDRGAALLAAMLTEHCLDQLLEARLLPTIGDEKLLSGFNSPIGTFSAKIELSYRVGILPPGLAKLLNGLRKIRNSFAHEVTGSFDTPSVAAKTEAAFQTNPTHYQEFMDQWTGNINSVMSEHGIEQKVDVTTIKLRVRFNNYFAQTVTILNSVSKDNLRLEPATYGKS
jgi:hypothetical protein